MIFNDYFFQGYVYHACEMCKKAIAMVNKLQVFSENEDIEEVSSIEIKQVLQCNRQLDLIFVFFYLYLHVDVVKYQLSGVCNSTDCLLGEL